MSSLPSVPCCDAFASVLALLIHFADIGRAISEFNCVRFTARHELHGLAVREKDVLEIDSHCTLFMVQQVPKQIHILSCDRSADVQDDKILSDNQAVDSAGHSRFTFELLCPSPFPDRLAKQRISRTV